MAEISYGGFSTSTTSRKDILESLRYAADKLLDSRINYHPEMTVIVSSSVYHEMATYHAREMWREMYRATRMLGNRSQAFKTIGSRRRFLELPAGWYCSKYLPENSVFQVQKQNYDFSKLPIDDTDGMGM